MTKETDNELADGGYIIFNMKGTVKEYQSGAVTREKEFQVSFESVLYEPKLQFTYNINPEEEDLCLVNLLLN